MVPPSHTKAMSTNQTSPTLPSADGPTETQGQYLAFIALFTKLHRRPPAEADMQAYFRVTAPSVHQMVVVLERRGFVRRQPGKPRSLEVLLPTELIPPLR